MKSFVIVWAISIILATTAKIYYHFLYLKSIRSPEMESYKTFASLLFTPLSPASLMAFPYVPRKVKEPLDSKLRSKVRIFSVIQISLVVLFLFSFYLST
jgi:ACR3 family arsenite efflux pump ArsB